MVSRIDPFGEKATDVTPFNNVLDKYLRCEKEQGRHGFGCRTQIRLGFLRNDGYHVRPEFDSVVDRTYACAFMGVPVPRPTPWDEFVPDFVRRRWEAEWPRVAGRQQNHQNGW